MRVIDFTRNLPQSITDTKSDQGVHPLVHKHYEESNSETAESFSVIYN